MEELNEAIKLSKRGKAPSPDGIRMEVVKWLDIDNRKWLLNSINEWWSDKTPPRRILPCEGSDNV